MTSWRMQLHPNIPGNSALHSAKCLTHGFVGLDFKWDVGDLMRADYAAIPQEEKVQWAFAHEMVEGDHVLIFVHHYPFALARISGPYNYIRNTEPELGVWFRHFRRVNDVRYFSDYKTNASAWKPITMTATLTPLRSEDSASQQLVNQWLEAVPAT